MEYGYFWKKGDYSLGKKEELGESRQSFLPNARQAKHLLRTIGSKKSSNMSSKWQIMTI